MLIVWIAIALVLILLAAYVAWLSERHQRLAARADAGWAALDAQLVRRAAPARVLGALRGQADLAEAAEAALFGGDAHREDTENALGRTLRRRGYDTLLPESDAARDMPGDGAAALTDLRAAAAKIQLARQFHNDAVRDLIAMRRRPVARMLRWGRDDPGGFARHYFEIDDTVAADPMSTGAGGRTD